MIHNLETLARVFLDVVVNCAKSVKPSYFIDIIVTNCLSFNTINQQICERFISRGGKQITLILNLDLFLYEKIKILKISERNCHEISYK